MRRPVCWGTYGLALLPGRSSSTTYAYDRLQRLTGVTAPAPQGSTTYGYDRVGNRVNRTRRGLSTTYTYDRADRITATQELGALSTAYTLDANGNTVQRGAETFSYDQANRLRSSTLGAVSYAYNGDGVRVSSTVGALTTRFVSDVNAALPVVLTEAAPTGTRKYVYGASGLAYVDEGLIAGIRVMHTDGLGSVRALTDSRGWVVQTYQTDEFGVPESLNSLGASTQPRQYTSEQRDQETGFVYLRARMYDPQLGRFIQADPLRKSGPGVGGWNRYSYVGNNPIGRTDPSGLRTYVIGGIIGSPNPDVQTFIDALIRKGVQNVFPQPVPAYGDYGEQGHSLLEQFIEALKVAGRSALAGADTDARNLKNQILQDLPNLQSGEQVNLIGYSGGATTAFNAAVLLEGRVRFSNIVTIGGVSYRSVPGNVETWTRITGSHDWLAGVPGFPQFHFNFAGVGHEDYFRTVLDRTVDTVWLVGVR